MASQHPHPWLAVLAAAGLAQASIPGLFAIQEQRIPGPNSSANDQFGGSEPRWVGDLDGDGIQDMVVGTPKADNDTGALVFLTMSYPGGVKRISSIAGRDPLLRTLLPTSTAKSARLGSAVAVVLPFATNRPCAILATIGGQVPRILTMKVCRDQGTLSVQSVRTSDTSASGALRGLGIGNLNFTGSLQLIDSLATGERVLALGMTHVGPSGNEHSGRVAILQVDTASLSVSQRSFFPASWEGTDIVGEGIQPNSQFGKSVARVGKTANFLRLAVLSGGSVGSHSGRVHMVDLDASYRVIAARWQALGVGSDTVAGPASLSGADFDHDGRTDLLVGAPSYNPDQSSFWVATLDPNSAVRGLQRFVRGTNGFADSNGILSNGSDFGSTVLAGDLNQDGMVDAFVGAPGPTTQAGALWSIRMKSAPFLRKAPDTLFVASPAPSYKMLNQYVGGKTQGWGVRALNPLGAYSPADCRILDGGDTASLLCHPGNFNGTSTWRITVYDTMNAPASVHVYDSLDFVVKTTGIVAYAFATDSIKLAPKAGIDLVRALDTLDAQRDSLRYQPVGNWPSWIRLGRFAITVSSADAKSDTVVKLAACKQLLPGPVTWCADTAFVSVRFDAATGVSRTTSAPRFSSHRGWLSAQGGSEPFRVEVFGTDGRRLGELSGGAFASRSLDLRGAPSTVVVRQRDGDKIRQSVRFLGD